MDDYQRMIRGTDHRTDQEIWNLVGNHPLIAKLREMYSAMQSLAFTLEADAALYAYIEKLENAAYDKLAAIHGAPSAELSNYESSRKPSDDGWSYAAFHYYAGTDDVWIGPLENVVR